MTTKDACGRLPYAPEPMKDLARRLPLSLDRIWEPESVGEAAVCRAHVFDCYSGVRLIISVERYDGDAWVHISGGICPSTPLYNAVASGKLADPAAVLVAEFLRVTRKLFAMAGATLPPLAKSFWTARAYHTFRKG